MKRVKKFYWKIFAVCLLLVFFIAFFGSSFSSDTVGSNWYSENKPSFTPPGWIFGPVWILLYFLIALSLYLAWINSNKREKKIIGIVFGTNLVFNGLWSYFFFGLRNASLAFFDIILIWISILAMIHFTWKINKKSAWLLVPYLLWVSFAVVLNFGFL